MIFIQDAVISFIGKIKSQIRLRKMIILTAFAGIALITCLLFSGVKLTYNVVYGDTVVGQISDVSVYEQAKKMAADTVIAENDATALLTDAKIKPALVSEVSVSSSEELVESILSNSDAVKKGYVVTVDGKDVFYLESCEEVNAALKARLAKYESLGDSSFVNEITVNEVYFETADLSKPETATAYIDKLDVVTTVTDTESIEIPFDTVTKTTSNKAAGYVLVTTKGVNGEKALTKKISYLNGKVTEEEILSSKVVSNPVNEVVVIGTASASYGSSNKYASSGGFVYPIEKVSGQVITSYWGDGRNHKAIDIGSDTGTKIYSSLSGTVSYAGYMGDYGYNVIVDHGNGVQTRYAHCSKLYVKAGDKVSAGQTIALVGNTGNSTGSHLHFEVILNGTRVDPAPYLGLY